MFYFAMVPLALLPSFIWLLFYFKKDVHPEPKRLILRVFLVSMISTLLVAFTIAAFQQESKAFPYLFNWKSALSPFLAFPLLVLFLNALWEETFKYLVVRFSILRNPEFDEPVDAMEYMVVAALGFAAVENIVVGFQFNNISSLISVLFVRFLGATFLHALCSAIVGFFLARAIFWKKNRKRYPLKIGFVLIGLAIAAVLHTFFNFLIIKSAGLEQLFFLWSVAALLFTLSLIVTWAFRRLDWESQRKG